jgi:phosphatidylserine decarboxylase
MIHKEGRKILSLAILFLLLINISAYWVFPQAVSLVLGMASIVLFGLMLQFFRNPARLLPTVDSHLVYAPADGKVVVIEEVFEPEYFKDQRIQVSIFMSPLDVHVNRSSLGGTVKYYQYHPGKYLVAWHPKSSTENERATVVIASEHAEVLLRQIAGAVARRIRTYVHVGQKVQQGEDFGFITFGSRVDIFLPLDAEIKVAIGAAVKGNRDVLAVV